MLTRLLYKILTFKTKVVRFRDAKLELFLADSLPKQILGLMHRSSLAQTQGMLFTFSSNARHGIWMYHMNFAIDCIWIGERGDVVDLIANIKPCKGMLSCPTYYPSANAKYVLELKAGAAKRLGIRSGTNLSPVLG
ncbi:MAG: DUF192 domain-containing protein [Candidatus Micrarchaeota archaeon]|nr:DUF192 domain-containing protein [Candidatus Micrarchaeota archaeon]